MDINQIRECAQRLKFTVHAKDEMLREEFGVIRENEVKETLLAGEVIEEYWENKASPAFLVFGKTKAKRPLHVVCAPVREENTLVIITVYQPDPRRWVDYRRRRR